jgi:hypothetical protein
MLRCVFWLCPFITLGKDHTENTASTLKEACLLLRYLVMDVNLLHEYASLEYVY